MSEQCACPLYEIRDDVFVQRRRRAVSFATRWLAASLVVGEWDAGELVPLVVDVPTPIVAAVSAYE
ncbi:MAG: hypothetical protein ACR2HY_00555 [Acidimicrobiales bacterium]